MDTTSKTKELPVGQRVYTKGFANKYFGSFKKRGFSGTMVFWLWCLRLQVYHLYCKYIRKDGREKLYHSEDVAFKYLNKKYGPFFQNDLKENMCNKSASNKVWVCWLQGVDSAPKPIQRCVESIQFHLKEHEIIIIDAQNYSQYVSLPDYIIEKWKRAVISNTHFSDILRLELLITHGGMWIDGDVFCTGGDYPSAMNDLPLFLFTNPLPSFPRAYQTDFAFSSWFISAKTNSVILTATRDFLYRYWYDMDFLTHYFLLHLTLSIVAKEYPNEWAQIPRELGVNATTLRGEKFNTFSKERWEQIKSLSCFHKLSYKQPGDFLKKDTFWDILINRNSVGLP